jgi:hypothetical protein
LGNWFSALIRGKAGAAVHFQEWCARWRNLRTPDRWFGRFVVTWFYYFIINNNEQMSGKDKACFKFQN